MRCWVGMAAALAAAWVPAFCVHAQDGRVGIREQLPYVDVVHEGKKVRIQRIQDVQHRLIDNWAHTSRPCPPSCIQPLRAAPGIETVAELELLEFLEQRVKLGTGVLVDARAPELHRLETIPSAMNIPGAILRAENPRIEKLLTALGARKRGARWEFGDAAELLLFGNGAWSDDSRLAVLALLDLGYPADKLKYFRGGLQSWRSLGLTTVVPARAP